MLEFDSVAMFYSLSATALVLVAGQYLVRRRHSFFQSILRLAALVCLSAVAAGAFWATVRSFSSVTALVDISDSLEEGEAEQVFARLKAMNSDSLSVSVLPFAGSVASYSQELSSDLRYSDLKKTWAKLNAGETNIEQALARGAATGSQTLLLLSDGYETAGDIVSYVKSTPGVRLFPLVPEPLPEIGKQFSIATLSAPLFVRTKQSVEIITGLRNESDQPQRGTLTLSQNNEEIEKKQVLLQPHTETLILTKSKPEVEDIQEIVATLTPDSKALPASVKRIFLSAEKNEKVLLLSGSPVDERLLAQVFRDQSYDLVRGVPGALPEFDSLSDFSAIILNNIPFRALPQLVERDLSRFLKSGGSMVMIGGNQSFGLGGYIGTEIEPLLPVKLIPPQQKKKRLNVGVILVIDKSGSMGRGRKLEFARVAAEEVSKSLKDDDYLGVYAFDQTPFRVIPIDRLRSIRSIIPERLSRISPARSTRLYPTLDDARRGFSNVPVGRKHVIVLTDGELPDQGPAYIDLVNRMRLAGITVSSVLLGGNPNRSFLRTLAESGGGGFYATNDPRSLPRIFIQDVKVSTGEETLKEDLEYLVRRGPDPLKSTQVKSFPPLRGYVETDRKPGASLELMVAAANKSSPLLAHWSVGKGKTIAFTSDANGRWSSLWARWSRFREFWTDVIRSGRNRADQGQVVPDFDLKYFLEKNELVLDLTIYSDTSYGNVAGTIRYADGSSHQVSFTELARNRYQAHLKDPFAGRADISVQVDDIALPALAIHLSGELFGERKGLGYAMPVLYQLASVTGGTLNPASDQLRATAIQSRDRSDLSGALLLAALILLLAEILLREMPTFFSRVFRRPSGRAALS